MRIWRPWWLCSVLSAVVALLAPAASVGEPSVKQVESRIVFHINRHDIDPAYAGNRRELDKIDRLIAEAGSDTSVVVTEILFSGYASPDGPLSFNNALAWKRVSSLEAYFNRPNSIGEGKNLNISDLCRRSCVAPLTLLASLVEDSDIRCKDRVLVIINDSAATPARRLHRLKLAEGGRMWDEIKPLLGELRYASVTVKYKQGAPRVAELPPPAVIPVTAASDSLPVDTLAALPVVETVQPLDTVTEYVVDYQDSCKPLYISLKSNILYDALLIPSIGAEFYVGRMFSISAAWSYAWWSSDRRHDYWRYYGGDIALRRWFGRMAEDKPLTGHHLGLYAQLFTYDFEFGGKGQMGHKYNYAGGIEYGFALPISRRLNLDFSVGVGFLWGEYYEYTPIDGHYVWQATKRRNWFGPTKAEVSLVWLIGCGNSNPLKGGAR